MFVAAVCMLFLVKLKWPKNKSVYEETDRRILVADWIVKSEDRKVKLAPMFFFFQSLSRNELNPRRETNKGP